MSTPLVTLEELRIASELVGLMYDFSFLFKHSVLAVDDDLIVDVDRTCTKWVSMIMYLFRCGSTT